MIFDAAPPEVVEGLVLYSPTSAPHSSSLVTEIRRFPPCLMNDEHFFLFIAEAGQAG
jgi:hypothetical protein